MFLDYDLRGLYPKELPPKLIADAIFQFYQKTKTKSPKAFLAVDTRESSRKIACFLVKLLPHYFEYLGILPTPIFYWLVITKNTPGVMVTASHLPKRYNGLKFLFPKGIVWVPKIKLHYPKERWPKGSLPRVISKTIYQEYFHQLREFTQGGKIKVSLKPKHPLTPILQKFLPMINLEVTRAPFLFQTDLDADRMILVYQGRKILPDIIFTKIVCQSQYQKVAAPIHMSQKLAKLIQKTGRKIIFLPTGHRYFKNAYLKKKIEFAFEPSGHFYFFQEMKTESPILALRKYLEVFETSDLDLQKSLKLFRVNFRLTKRINLERLVKKLIQELKPEKIKPFDGYLLQEKENWCHLRLSKTELKLRVSGEGNRKFAQKYFSKIKLWLSKN